jgi:predicted amidophosphoribosyltransferase
VDGVIGKELSMTTSEKTVERRCPECATPMRASDRFCTRCGNEVGRVPADPGASGVRWMARAA